MSDICSSSQRQAAFALELILSEQPELFCNMVGQPCIRLPSAPDYPAHEPFILRSQRVRAWAAEFIWQKSRIVLLDREIDRILNVLEGKAWLDLRLDIELCEAIENDPVLEAVLLLLEKTNPFEGTVTKLQRDLIHVAKKAGLDVKCRSWPKGTPHLGNRVRTLERFLEMANVTVERRRSGVQRTIRLIWKRSDDGPSPASQVTSADKFHHPKHQRLHDAGDPAERAKVFAQVKRPEVGNKS